MVCTRGFHRGTNYKEARHVKALISDIDGTLLGDQPGAAEYNEFVMARPDDLYTVYATGRNAGSWGNFVETGGIVLPHAVILNVGADIYFSFDGEYALDKEWHEEIADPSFTPRNIMTALEPVKGMRLQEFIHQFKVSYYTDPGANPAELERECRQRLLDRGIQATVIPSHGEFLDVLPERCDKAKAARYLLKKERIKEDDAVVAGDSENDLALFLAFKKGIIVSNALPELKEKLSGMGKFEAVKPYAAGVVEGLKFYFNL